MKVDSIVVAMRTCQWCTAYERASGNIPFHDTAESSSGVYGSYGSEKKEQVEYLYKSDFRLNGQVDSILPIKTARSFLLHQ